MDELLERLIGPSVRGPALAIFEDVHWFDPTSLELMGLAVRRAVHLPMMIVVTHRPEFLPPWLELGHVTLLKLSNLARRDAVALIRKAADGKALPDPLVEQISAKAQGVPLFIEEITRSILNRAI